MSKRNERQFLFYSASFFTAYLNNSFFGNKAYDELLLTDKSL